MGYVGNERYIEPNVAAKVVDGRLNSNLLNDPSWMSNLRSHQPLVGIDEQSITLEQPFV
jgi:hypothetical protein